MKAAQSQVDQTTHELPTATTKLTGLRNAAAGFAICAASAVAVSLLLRHVPFVESLPFAFLAVVALVAHRFGTPSGILGLIGGAFVFAIFLYPPVGSLSINDAPQRTNVVLMLLFGLAVAYFYGTGTSDDGSDDQKS